MECYQIVLEIFEELLARTRSQPGRPGEAHAVFSMDGGVGRDLVGGARAGSALVRAAIPELSPMPDDPGTASAVLDAFLHYCLEDHQFLADELFHFCILKWMAERGLPMYKYDSP